MVFHSDLDQESLLTGSTGALTAPALDAFWTLAARLGVVASLRITHTEGESLGLSAGVPDPLSLFHDHGAMVSASVTGGHGYHASSRCDLPALLTALDQAAARARMMAGAGLMDGLNWPSPFEMQRLEEPLAARTVSVPGMQPLPSRNDMLSRLRAESAQAHCFADVVGSEFKITVQRSRQSLWHDGVLIGHFENHFVEPHAQVTVAHGAEAQTRSLAGRYNGFCQQGGAEVLGRSGLEGCGQRLAEEAGKLARAPNCPDMCTELLLMPDQMMLQIHESIGHPLELDRILGDERNFAGTSFVSLDMFGTYQYGSPLLNVSFDPSGHPHQLASYAFDDEGFGARKAFVIEKGLLLQPLGSALSARRAERLGHVFTPVANARAVGWHRAPIDRMANLNVEAGDRSMAQLIGGIEEGILMRTNVSWSIDDSRNKFQFGCEWGQMIRKGELAEVVRNPGYRGISASFWRSLSAVGDASTMEVMGTPFCGKGEPGQVIRVGHASPACVFSGVDVFGASS